VKISNGVMFIGADGVIRFLMNSECGIYEMREGHGWEFMCRSDMIYISTDIEISTHTPDKLIVEG
jgi:hypothetical protein